MECKLCSVGFAESQDEVVLCNHHDGLVHMGCCTTNCSEDGKPCEHCEAIFTKKARML